MIHRSCIQDIGKGPLHKNEEVGQIIYNMLWQAGIFHATAHQTYAYIASNVLTIGKEKKEGGKQRRRE